MKRETRGERVCCEWWDLRKEEEEERKKKKMGQLRSPPHACGSEFPYKGRNPPTRVSLIQRDSDRISTDPETDRIKLARNPNLLARSIGAREKQTY